MVSGLVKLMSFISGQFLFVGFTAFGTVVLVCFLIFFVYKAITKKIINHNLRRIDTYIKSSESLFVNTTSRRESLESLPAELKICEYDITLISVFFSRYSGKIKENADLGTVSLLIDTTDHLKHCKAIILELNEVGQIDEAAKEKIKLFRKAFFQFAYSFYRFRTAYPGEPAY